MKLALFVVVVFFFITNTNTPTFELRAECKALKGDNLGISIANTTDFNSPLATLFKIFLSYFHFDQIYIIIRWKAYFAFFTSLFGQKMCIELFVATAVHVVDLNEGSETSGPQCQLSNNRNCWLQIERGILVHFNLLLRLVQSSRLLFSQYVRYFTAK